MSGIIAIGGMLSVIFSSLFGYLFTKGYNRDIQKLVVELAEAQADM